jgi:hypothetical protein
MEAERSRTGIPIDAGTWDRLTKSAESLNVPLPVAPATGES